MRGGLVSWHGLMGVSVVCDGVRGGFGSCCWSLNCRILVFVKGGVTALPLHSPLPISSLLPRQPVIHPVCELNECNEACCPYLYTQTPHNCIHTHQLTLTSHDKPGSPCLHQYFPSIYSHQGSCLCICVCLHLVACASVCSRAFISVIPRKQQAG